MTTKGERQEMGEDRDRCHRDRMWDRGVDRKDGDANGDANGDVASDAE